MKEVVVTLTKGCKVLVNGVYHKAEPNVGLPAIFEIHSIENLNSDITDLLEWANMQSKGFVLEILEELVLEQM